MTISDYADLFSLLIDGAVSRHKASSNLDDLHEPTRIIDMLSKELSEEESKKLDAAIHLKTAEYNHG